MLIMARNKESCRTCYDPGLWGKYRTENIDIFGPIEVKSATVVLWCRNMGLFSSKEEIPQRSYSNSTNYGRSYTQTQTAEQVQQIYRAYREEELRKRQLERDLINQFNRLSISRASSIQESHTSAADSAYSFQPISVRVNENLKYELLRNDGDYTNLNNNNCIYELTLLAEYDTEYFTIKNMFTSTNKKCFKVTSIQKIFNPYLLAQYKLMEKCYIKRYGYTTTKQLFHGTKRQNITNICKYNFNWRLKGTARGHIFGQGVSFTPISNYATNYGDKTFDKVMIVANVLVSNKCLGEKDTIIPPSNYDTTTKENDHVYVKYEDNTFYPAYVIFYQGVDTSKKPQRRRY